MIMVAGIRCLIVPSALDLNHQSVCDIRRDCLYDCVTMRKAIFYVRLIEIELDSMIEPDISKAPFAEQKFMVRAVLPVRTFLTPLKRH